MMVPRRCRPTAAVLSTATIFILRPPTLLPAVAQQASTISAGGGITLIFLDSDCTTCIGVAVARDNEPLIAVDCNTNDSRDDNGGENTDLDRKAWIPDILSGSTIAESLCLASYPTLCVVEDSDGRTLRIRENGAADPFVMGNDVSDPIRSILTEDACVTRRDGDGGGKIVLEDCETMASRGRRDQLWTKTGYSDWNDDCSSFRGMVIYNEDDCRSCIVAADVGSGKEIVVGDCNDERDSEKYWTFRNNGHWCLESDDNLCVTIANAAGHLFLEEKVDDDQLQDWVYYNDDRNAITPRVASDLCVAMDDNGDVDIDSCGSVIDGSASWKMVDYDRGYALECLSQQEEEESTACKDGDMFALVAPDCDVCIGHADGRLSLVDCTTAQNSTKLWDLTSTGAWRLMEDTSQCVGSDLQLQRCIDGRQDETWTYTGFDTTDGDDRNVGKRRIVLWSASSAGSYGYGCVGRRDESSRNLELLPCDSTTANLEWDMATDTCDYQCYGALYADGSGSDRGPLGGSGLMALMGAAAFLWMHWW
mmetsp:Transcript_28217/g.61993  ORF Transcript_28217/g.61993 Transcript_28217/m.61993 type:complete len:535 (-) Transcript_28217:270-1874(-)